MEELQAALEIEREKLYSHMKGKPFEITREDRIVMGISMEFERLQTRRESGYYADRPEELNKDILMTLDSMRDEIVSLMRVIRDMATRPSSGHGKIAEILMEVI